jgi:hypothetical protein
MEWASGTRLWSRGLLHPCPADPPTPIPLGSLRTCAHKCKEPSVYAAQSSRWLLGPRTAPFSREDSCVNVQKVYAAWMEVENMTCRFELRRKRRGPS